MAYPNRDRHTNRTAINAECAGRLPSDWILRWDASTDQETLGYNTDEATNDVDSLTLRGGKFAAHGEVTLSSTGGTSVYPSFEYDDDGLPNLHCNDDIALNTGNLQSQNWHIWDKIDDYNDLTVFLVVRYPDMAGEGTSNHYALVGGNSYRFGNVGTDLTPTLFNAGTFRNCTNDFDDRRMIQIGTNLHNGTNDNDTYYYVGKTVADSALAKSDASMSGGNFISMGSYSTNSNPSVWAMDCRIYEALWYDRYMSTSEREAVVDYLSAKWECTNADNSSDTITSTTEEQWAAGFDDVTGIQATNSPVRRSITQLPDPDVPFAGGTNIKDPNFAINLIDARAATTNGKQYFSADDVERFTYTGGGYPEVDYLTSVFGGLWDASAGLDIVENPGIGNNYFDFTGSTVTLTQNDSINGLGLDGWGYAVVAHRPEASGTQMRVLTIDSTRYWYYGQYPTWGNTNCPMFYGKNASTAEGPQMRLAWEGGSDVVGALPNGDLDRKHVVLWKWDYAAGELTWWRNGMWMCSREIDAAYANFSAAVHYSLGATYASALGHPNMKAWEAGFWIGSAANTITDAEMEDLQRHLCAKHGLDYMPENTPFMIGGGGGAALNTADTQSCVWLFKADGDQCSTNRWVADGCDERFTTTGSFELNPTDGVGEPTKEFAYGRECVAFTSTDGLHDATTYTWTESTICGAPRGYSTYVIAELTDAASPVSNGYAADTTGIQIRRNGTTDKWDCRVAGATMTSVSSYENELVLIVGTYDFTEQTARAYINEETLSDSSPTVSSLGAATISIGQDSAGSNNGDIRVMEVGAYKHKLTQPDIDNLLKYARQRYDAPFD